MVFKDNDRDKVNEDIDIDSIEDDDGQVDDDSQVTDDNQDEDVDDSNDDDQSNSKNDDDSSTKKDEKDADYWKEKFANSSREAQILAEREKKANEKIEELTKPKEINDDVMKQRFPDWDNYDDAVKTVLKNDAVRDQEVKQLKKQTSEFHNERRWKGKVDSFLDENQETERYPAVKGKAEEFKKFANKPERKGMDLDILAQAFGYQVGDTEKPKPKNSGKKRDMLESGSGNGATKKHTTTKKGYSADDAKRLRENNPREYERLVRAGEIDIKI